MNEPPAGADTVGDSVGDARGWDVADAEAVRDATARPDVETYRACLPSLVASGGMWVGISTGYRRIGLLFEKHRDHFGRDGDDVLCISGATEVFNPTIDVAAIAKARAVDSGVTLRRSCPTTTLTLRSTMTGRWSWGRAPSCATAHLLIRQAAAMTATVWRLVITRGRGPTDVSCSTWCVVMRRRSTRRW
jgi:hypothetical protein